MKEVWKDVAGYEGLYQVSNLGRVKALPREGAKKIGIMHQLVHGTNGYCYVHLRKNKHTKMHRVHSLVAKAFLDNCDSHQEINHIDEDKTNNTVFNLEWCSHSHNLNHGTRNQRAVDTRKKHSRPFICENNGKIYRSQAECARELNIQTSKLCMVLHGKRAHTCGYHFRFIGGQT